MYYSNSQANICKKVSYGVKYILKVTWSNNNQKRNVTVLI